MFEYDKQLEFMELFCDHDGCDKSVSTNGDFTTALAAAKAKGWTVRKIDGAWKHFCIVHANEGVA